MNTITITFKDNSTKEFPINTTVSEVASMYETSYTWSSFK